MAMAATMMEWSTEQQLKVLRQVELGLTQEVFEEWVKQNANLSSTKLQEAAITVYDLYMDSVTPASLDEGFAGFPADKAEIKMKQRETEDKNVGRVMSVGGEQVLIVGKKSDGRYVAMDKKGSKTYKKGSAYGLGEEVENVEEVYKGKHGQSDKEYADSRSQGGKMVSGDSKQSGAEYTHGRRVKAANPGMQPDVGGKTKPKSQGKMDKGTRADLEYRKANLKKEETEVEEAYKPIDKKKENAMYRRAGNLARTSLSSKGKAKADAQDKSSKIVSAISRQKENERFSKMADEKARSNYKEHYSWRKEMGVEE